MFSLIKKLFGGQQEENHDEKVVPKEEVSAHEPEESPSICQPQQNEVEIALRAAEVARHEKVARHQAMLDTIRCCEIIPTEKMAPKLNISVLENVKYSTVTKKTPLEGIGDFVSIDTETTGLQASSCEIVEVAAVRFRDFVPVEKFSTLLSTKKPIPAEATKVNGITDDMVAGHPHFRQIAAQLQEFIGSDNLVGHNLEFDLKFLAKNGVDVAAQKRKYFDTLAIAQKTLRKVKMKWDKELQFYTENYDSDYDVYDYKLKSLCFYYGIVHMDAHRAEGDAIAAGMVFQRLIDTRLNK